MGFPNDTRRSRPWDQGFLVAVPVPVTLPLTLPASVSEGVGKPWLSTMVGLGVRLWIGVGAIAVAAACRIVSVPGISSFSSSCSSCPLIRARILARVVRSAARVSAAFPGPVSLVMPRALRSLAPMAFPFPFHACCAACTAVPPATSFPGQTFLDLRPIMF